MGDMIYVVPLLCFVVLLIVGFLAMRAGLGWIVIALAVGFACLAAWAIWIGRQESGWDGIGYAIVAILMATPAGMGVLAGGGLALWRMRRGE